MCRMVNATIISVCLALLSWSSEAECSCYAKKAEQWPNEARWDDNRFNKEVAIAVQSDYGDTHNPDWCGYGDRNSGLSGADRLVNWLSRYGWRTSHRIVNEHLQASDIKDASHGGADHGDCGDLFLYVGHGPNVGLGSSDPLWKIGEGYLHVHPESGPTDCAAGGNNVKHYECRWGDGDAEWVIMYTCHWLENRSDPDIRQRTDELVKHGLHAIMGFDSTMNVVAESLEWFGRIATGELPSPLPPPVFNGPVCFSPEYEPVSIRRAWFGSQKDWQAYEAPLGVSRDLVYICVEGYEDEFLPGNIRNHRPKRDPTGPVVVTAIPYPYIGKGGQGPEPTWRPTIPD